ncbi:MAG: class I SAM-dependent methyltransferase [Thermodesulfobacteriota bacterium]
MNGFEDDIDFYLRFLAGGRSVLELGCGSGRITRALVKHGFRTVGIDISMEMLGKSPKIDGVNQNYLCMDMTMPGLTTRFDAVIIGYNTLNLLTSPPLISKCLKETKQLLTPGGLCIFHLHTLSQELAESAGKKIFQFQILERDDGGRVIKETLKQFDLEQNHLVMEERFRVRPPAGSNHSKEDLSHHYRFISLPSHHWLQLIEESGLRVSHVHGGYRQQPFRPGQDATMLVVAQN